MLCQSSVYATRAKAHKLMTVVSLIPMVVGVTENGVAPRLQIRKKVACNVILMLLLLLALYPGLWEEAAAAKVFSYECQANQFTAATQPVALCTAVNAVLATPQSATENADAFAKITASNVTILGAAPTFTFSLNMLTWSYVGTPYAGEIFWVQPARAFGTGGYALPSGSYTNWQSGVLPVRT